MSVDNDDRFWRGDYSPIFGIALVLPGNCRVATDKRVELITAHVPNHICSCHHASKRSKKEGTFLLHREHGSHIDRKSTRLNSSHGYISYAVFCLKKKKIK